MGSGNGVDTGVDDRWCVEANLLAAIVTRGAPAIVDLKDTPFERTWLSDIYRLAYDAAERLALRGELISTWKVVDEVRHTRSELVAASVRIVLEGAIQVHGADIDPFTVKRIANDLADLRAEETATTDTADECLSVHEIFAPLPPINWLCEPLEMAPGAPTLIAGYGFSGKTLCAQDLGLAVAGGLVAWGRFRVRRGRVLHVDYEQGSHLTRTRYQRLARGHGIDWRDLEGYLRLLTLPRWYLDDDDADDRLVRLCEGVDLLIIDSFRAACPATDENSSEARVALDRLTRISERTGTTPLVIHHARKPHKDAAGGARMAIRGSGALYDALGCALVFSGEKGEPITVEPDKARITGRPGPNFQIQIEDVEIDGDPRAALRLWSIESAPSDAGAAKVTPAAKLAVIKERVLDFIREQGGTTGGTNVVVASLGIRKELAGAAVAELVRSKLLVRGGTKNDPTLSLPGTTYDQK